MKTLSYKDIKFDLIEPKKAVRDGDAFLILHGLPGQFSTNLDLGFYLAAEKQLPCFFPYGRGLGRSNGSPSLIDHVETLVDFVEHMKSEYGIKRAQLIGHSWGGFMAINLWMRVPEFFEKVVLLAPLVKMPPNDAVRDRIESLANQMNKIVGYDVNVDKLMADAKVMEHEMLPMLHTEKLKEMGFSGTIIHGDDDVVIPIEHSEEFCKNIGESVKLIEVKDNHYLVDRLPLKDHVLGQFQ